MAIADLIADLEKASEGHRSLDAAIGILLGWRRKVEYLKTEEGGEPVRRVFWIVPSGDDPGRVPYFTTSIEDAFLLARTIAPGHTGGVSWDDDGRGTAIVDGGPYCEAATPALALCAAALRAKLEKEEQEE
ncbi:hypothetical protein CN934_26855 [Ensifer sp. MMN_5]|nr:hypothetical protein CN934_26855 [Ensifer sp. MMN_5]